MPENDPSRDPWDYSGPRRAEARGRLGSSTVASTDLMTDRPPPPDDPDADAAWEPPSEGLVLGVMARHGCSRQEALRRLGVDPAAMPSAVRFRALPDGARFLYRRFECVKHRPRVWSGGRRVPDRDYDYDVRVDRPHRRPNAQVTTPVGPRRYAWLYVHPDALVDPLDDPPARRLRR